MLAPIRTPQAPGGFPDGIRPVFLEVGAAPTAGNAPYPPGSVVRFGTLYYLNLGTLATPSWAQISTVVAQNLTALSGLAKLTAGVFSAAAAGVDYAKGPWKTFSTVRNVGAAQTLSIPVVDGSNNGIIRATGVLVSDGVDRALAAKVNGSATNVHVQELYGNSTTTAADRTSVGVTGPYGAMFELVFVTAPTAGALRRFGIIRMAAYSASLIQQVYIAGIGFKDTTTAITSIDLDCGNATGLAANTFAMVEEGIIG